MIEQSIVHLPELLKDIDRLVSNYLVYLSSTKSEAVIRRAGSLGTQPFLLRYSPEHVEGRFRELRL
jgi:hypothetical protein